MREKIIFDGVVEIDIKEIQDVIERFCLDIGIQPGLDLKVDEIGSRQIWKTERSPGEFITHGYFDLNLMSSENSKPVFLRIVSCRDVLDGLFFIVSQRLQAKYLLPNFPPETFSVPLRELIESGFVSPEELNDKEIDPAKNVKKYGTDRDMTELEVGRLVKQCRHHQSKGGTTPSFYENLPPATQNKFALGTLKDWVKNPKFKTS